MRGLRIEAGYDLPVLVDELDIRLWVVPFDNPGGGLGAFAGVEQAANDLRDLTKGIIGDLGLPDAVSHGDAWFQTGPC